MSINTRLDHTPAPIKTSNYQEWLWYTLHDAETVGKERGYIPIDSEAMDDYRRPLSGREQEIRDDCELAVRQQGA
jgi:hypothetical protein